MATLLEKLRKAIQKANEEEKKKKAIEDAAYKNLKEQQKQFKSNVKSSIKKATTIKSTESIDRDYGYNTKYQPKTSAQINRETVKKSNEITDKSNAQKNTSNTKILLKYRKEAADKGLKGEKAYEYAVKKYNADASVQELSKHTNTSDIRSKKLASNLAVNNEDLYGSDKDAQTKISAGMESNTLRRQIKEISSDKITYTPTGILDRERNTSGAINNISEDDLLKVDYLYGAGRDREAKDLENQLIADAEQANEIAKAQQSQSDTGNFALNTIKEGAISAGQGIGQIGSRVLFNNISPVVTKADSLKYQKELSEATGAKKFFAQVGYSAAQMASTGGMPGFFVSIAGNDYTQARRDGKTDSEALSYSIMDASMETLLMKVGGKLVGGINQFVGSKSLLKDAIAKAVKNPVMQRTIGYVADMAAEGTEEYIQAVLNPLVENIAYNEQNKIDLTPEGGGEAFLVGATMALFMNSGSAISTYGADVLTIKEDIRLSDGTYLSSDSIDRYFKNQATEEDIAAIKEFGKNVNEKDLNKVFDKINAVAEVNLGAKKYSEVIQEAKSLDASDRIDYYANLLSSPAYQMSVESYLDKAKQISQKTDYEKGIQGIREKTATALGQKYGANVEFVDNPDTEVHGYIDKATNTVYLNRNSDKSILVTMIHELTHSTENSGFYKEMRRASEQYFNEKNIDIESFKADTRQVYKERNAELTEEGLNQEITAKFMADVVFGKEADIIDFVYKNKSLGQKIYDWIVETLGITKKAGNNDALIKAKENFEKALSDKREGAASDKVQYDISKSFSEQIDACISKTLKKGEVIYVGDTTAPMLAIGAEKRPVIVTQETINKAYRKESAKKHGHELTKDMIKRIPEQLKDPIMILKSETAKNSLVVVTEIKNKNNENVIVALHLNKQEKYQLVNRIASAYGKNNVEGFIYDQVFLNNNLLYYNKNKANRLLRSFRLQLPEENTTISSDIILPPNGVVVNNIIRKEINNDTKQYDIGKNFNEFTDQDSQEANALNVSTKKVVGKYNKALYNKNYTKEQLRYFYKRRDEFKTFIENAINSHTGAFKNFTELEKAQNKFIKDVNSFISDTKKAMHEMKPHIKAVNNDIKNMNLKQQQQELLKIQKENMRHQEEEFAKIDKMRAAENAKPKKLDIEGKKIEVETAKELTQTEKTLIAKEVKDSRKVFEGYNQYQEQELAELKRRYAMLEKSIKVETEEDKQKKLEQKIMREYEHEKKVEKYAINFTPLLPKRLNILAARTLLTDSGAAIADMDKDIFGKQNKIAHIYKYYNIAKSGRGSGMAAIGNVQTNLKGEVVGKSLKEVFAPIEKANKKDDKYASKFYSYLWHRHNIDRYKRGKGIFGADVTSEQSKGIVDKYEISNPEFKAYAEDVYKFLRNNLQMRVDAGLITKNFAEMLNDLYEFYVPTSREIMQKEDMGNALDMEATPKAKPKKVGQTIGTATESDWMLADLQTAIARQTMQVYKTSYRNMFANKLYDTAKANEDNINIGQYVYGVEVLKDGANPADKHGIVFYKDGVRLQMLTSKEVHTTFASMFPTSHDDYIAVVRGVEHLSNGFKKLITSYSPMFLIRNPIKDIGDALIYTKNPFNKYLAAIPKAAAEMAKNTDNFQKYIGSGALYASYFDYIQNAGMKLKKKNMNKLEQANFYVEQLPRFAEYLATMETLKKDIESGKITEYEAHAQAMYNAADITVNFNRSGTATKVANRTFVPFINAGVQGTAKITRLFTEGGTTKQYVGLAVKATLFGFGLSALNELLLGDDDEWEKIPDTIKETHYLFKIGDGKYIRIPKGRFASVIAMIPDFIIKKAKGEEADFGQLIDMVWTQIGFSDPIRNNIFGTLYDVAKNQTWYGGEIESQSMQNKKESERYDENTDYVSRWIGKTLNKSPAKINYILDAYLGVIADFLLPVITPKTMGGSAKDYILAPFKKAFSLDTQATNNLGQRFYDEAEKIAQDYNSANSSKGIEFVNRYMNKQKSLVSEVYKSINEIEADTTLSLEDKNDRISVLKGSINTIEQNTLDNLDTVKKKAAIYYKDGTETETNLQYAKMNKEIFGAEYALKTYNSDVYEKAKTYNNAGISYSTFYDYYFATKDLDAKNSKGETVTGLKKMRVRSAINSLNTTADKKLFLYALYSNYKLTANEAKKVKAYINSLNITVKEKKALYEQCNTD